jgi:serine/tyrosine/threonine adenylyltransferase
MNSPDLPFTARLRVDELALGNTFGELPPAFYTRLNPTPLPSPYLVCASESAAALIGLDPAELNSDDFLQVFSGNAVHPHAQPLAAVYSGHQFGVWAGQLGDGRAILLGDAKAPGEPHGTLELQLKGSGKTPYSRMGDGRAVLRSSIREFLCSEAMAGLRIPTSRALCVIGSDLRVMRELPETTAVVTRMAQSFVRFGSFEHWFYHQQPQALKTLADYVLRQNYPELLDAPDPYASLLREVTRRTAELVAQWQSVGFMHGVLNTDNMSILGITLDYGPFGFMEAYDPAHICNHTDQQGRYSYRMQPRIGEWNCYALGQAMVSLIGDVDEVHQALAVYQSAFDAKMAALWQAKLGLRGREDGDDQLLAALLEILASNRVDFPLFFRRLSALKTDSANNDAPLRDLFIDRPAFDAWSVKYRLRLKQEQSNDAARKLSMDQVNPKYVLRNYLAQAAIEKAQQKDFSEVQRLLQVLQRPYDEQPEHDAYAELPPDWAAGIEVSCSS